MDIKNPEYILEIAHQMSVTRAAEKLFITQSTLSQYLLKLEAELGTPLFLRDKNRLVPTDAGRIYLQAAADVVRIQDAARASIAALKNEGCIRLGCSSWGLDLVANSLPAFKEAFPSITLKLFENRYLQLKAMMQAGKIDLAVIAITPEDDLPAQGFTPLCREELVLVLPKDHPFCVSHPRTRKIAPGVLAEELRDVSFVFSDEGSTIRKLEDQLFADLMFRPNVVCELNRDDFTQKMVANGVGAAIVPAADIRGFATVRSFRFDPPLCREDILVFRKGAEKTEALACLEKLLVRNSQSNRQVEFLAEG
ncbi:LysR family transcriptional regulator [Oscillibacter sp.]|uniref:LysR family transcriptional regulator n=1 Tax=Oscillibacter sp. TaxID=1945593 RepID=UPI00262AA2F1|nr:LysR family transcriptional regulator [Oscillibacter sp.]MDD3346112.1 LysR family transcriptional regulator [Oscillibacter sp.]